MKTAVVVAFDRLPLRLLGCYGRIPSLTPNFDRLAAESVVFDWHFAENVDPLAAGHAWWTGRYQFRLSAAEQQRQPETLFDLLAAAGVEVVGVGESTPPTATMPRSPHLKWKVTPLTEKSRGVFREAAGLLNGSGTERLLWVRVTGIESNDGRDSFDLENSIRRLDEAFGRFCDALREHRRATGEEVLTIVTAAAGTPLDASEADVMDSRLPEVLQRIAECNVHTPLLVHTGGGSGWRQSSLVQTVDLAATLLEWFGVSFGDAVLDGQSLLPLLTHAATPPGREFVCFGDGRRSCGIRSRDFCLLAPGSECEAPTGSGADQSRIRLFVKPDDVWEVHDVANQEPETAARLLTQLREFVAQRTAG